MTDEVTVTQADNDLCNTIHSLMVRNEWREAAKYAARHRIASQQAVPNSVVEAVEIEAEKIWDTEGDRDDYYRCEYGELTERKRDALRVKALRNLRHTPTLQGQTAPAGDVVEALKAACTALENRKVLVDMVLDASAEQGRKVLAALTAAKSQDAELLRALSDAVGKLPVEEMVHADRQGNLELIGYAMQAQGEWDIVVRAKAAADTHLSGDPA